MARALTLPGSGLKRLGSFAVGAGMIAASFLTIRHFYAANFPASIFEGSFCDLSAFFNCDSSAFSSIAQWRGVPMGWAGLLVGALVLLGAIFPSASFERTNKGIALLNALGVLGLLGYSVFVLRSLCLLCTGYYLFSLLSFFLFWRYGLRSDGRGLAGFLGTYVRPSLKVAVVALAALAVGALAFQNFTAAKKEAQMGGVTARVVKEFYALEEVPWPSFVSPYFIAQATPVFEDAPIRVVEYADYLCPDCLFLHQQLVRLKAEFAGKVNIAFQFYPLDTCNTAVVEKAGLHPGACDLSLIAAHNPGLFPAIHEEIFANFQAAKQPEWRAELARRYGVEAALADPATRDMVQRIIATGAEYERTSEKFGAGIRSTPTLIVNGRMIIGTLPDAHMRAIFESILAGAEKSPGQGGGKFIENWVNTRKAKPARTKPGAQK
ncbi:MAG: hypothetical protein FJY80_04200 [Candidatus Aminicenantes bacterium]|nr:hypothetical protein [Candidatus Aminicenantes bacterium]